MIATRRIGPHEIPTAKDLIYRIAHQIFQDGRTLEEGVAYYEARGQLHDMDEVQETYFDRDGLFLVMTDKNRIIATGAIRKLDDTTCELKRVRLLLGYQVIQELPAFARQKGYRRVRLETDRDDQRLGFYEIPRYSDNEDDAAMEMILS